VLPVKGVMPLTRTERLLRVFTDVRPGEGSTALLMFANVFLILCAYYLIKPLREGWIAISGIPSLSKMEVKAYSSLAQSLLLIFVVGRYARLVDRFPRATVIKRATLFCMSNLVIFWVLQPEFFLQGLPGTGVIFYLWVGMFGVFVVAQFWAFAADLYTQEQGARLIPLVAIGATAGAAFGAWITQTLIDAGLLPTEYLLLAAIVPLAASMGLTQMADRRMPAATETTSKAQDAKVDESAAKAPPPSTGGSFGLVFAHRYLLLVALTTLLVNWVNTNGENLLFRVVQEVLASNALDQGVTGERQILEFTRDGTTAFYGGFYFWVNTVALVLQSLVASRLLKYGGFGVLFMMLPVVALASYTAMALVPIIAVVRLMKIAENATDYSLNNTARSVLWLPLSAELKYKGKPVIDTFFVRVGDGLAALTVMVGVQVLALRTASFFAFNVALVLVWIGVAALVVREYRRTVATSADSGSVAGA